MTYAIAGGPRPEWHGLTEAEAVTLCRRCAAEVANRVGRKGVRIDPDGLLGYAWEGFVRGCETFDPADGRPLEDYLRMRIGFTIIDWMRTNDKTRQLARGFRPVVVTSPLGFPSPGVCLTPTDYRATAPAEAWDATKCLRAALPMRERVMLYLYFHEAWLMHEVGDALDLSESRVSQTFDRALAHMREEAGLRGLALGDFVPRHEPPARFECFAEVVADRKESCRDRVDLSKCVRN